MSSERLDKQWQKKGLGAYSTEAILGTLGHYGIVTDEAGFKTLAGQKWPLELSMDWSKDWKATGPFGPLPAAATEELWRRFLKTTQPADLALALGVVVGKGAQALEGKGELEGALGALEQIVPTLPAAGDSRERFMAEVVFRLQRVLVAFDTLAEKLVTKGQLPLAERLVKIEEQLFPVRAGVSSALVRAAKGEVEPAVESLTVIAQDKEKDGYARLSAIDALLHLKRPRPAYTPALEMGEVALREHDHDFFDELMHRLQRIHQETSELPEEAPNHVRLDALLDELGNHHHHHHH